MAHEEEIRRLRASMRSLTAPALVQELIDTAGRYGLEQTPLGKETTELLRTELLRRLGGDQAGEMEWSNVDALFAQAVIALNYPQALSLVQLLDTLIALSFRYGASRRVIADPKREATRMMRDRFVGEALDRLRGAVPRKKIAVL